MLKRNIFVFTLLFALVSSIFTSSVTAAPVEYGEELKNAPETTPSVSFTDVAGHWAYPYIAEMVNKKVISGYPDNKFRPDNTISRAEFATIIIKAAGLQAQKVNYSSFSDVKVSDWYSPFIETAKDYMTGYRTANGQYIFNPSAPALREDITVAIVKLKGYDVSRLANRSIIEAMFRDYEGISEGAKDYVSIAVEYGLVSGYENETFRPQNSVTRAEAATLLWRAFMYGNDNKDIGGGTSQPAAPAAPVNPVAEPPSTTNPQNPEQSPSQPDKFSVDTLVGGIGQGDVDGPVYKAKINQIDSMVLDKDDNIYWLDSEKRKVRKFNKSNGTVETYKLIDNQFNWLLETDAGLIQHDSSNLSPQRLVYNYSTSNLYMLGSQKDITNSWVNPDYHKVIFNITSDVEASVYAEKGGPSLDFAALADNDGIIYGNAVEYTCGNSSSCTGSGVHYQIFQSQIEGADEPLIDMQVTDAYTGSQSDIMIKGNYVYILTIGEANFTGHTDTALQRIQIFPFKYETVAKYMNTAFDSVMTYNGEFYMAQGASIYKMGLDGKYSLFLDENSLTYNDGNAIRRIDNFTFDSAGNVILYEGTSKSIRRINL